MNEVTSKFRFRRLNNNSIKRSNRPMIYYLQYENRETNIPLLSLKPHKTNLENDRSPNHTRQWVINREQNTIKAAHLIKLEMFGTKQWNEETKLL